MPTDAFLLRVALRTYQLQCQEDPEFADEHDPYEVFKRKLQRSRALRRQVLAGVKNSLGKLVLDLTYARKPPKRNVPGMFSLVRCARAPLKGQMVFLGEIPNKRGHAIAITLEGQVMDEHLGDFKELTDEEI